MSYLRAKMAVEGDMTDLWDTWDEKAAARAAADASRFDRERRTLAEILLARGHAKAAALVAISMYRCDRVDNWDGGQFETVLSVPATQFDLVTGDIREAIESAALAITGAGHFAGLSVEVKIAEAS